MLRLVSKFHRTSRQFVAVSSVFCTARALIHSSPGGKDVNVATLTRAGVQEWARLNLGEDSEDVAKVFEAKKVDGAALLELSETHLKEMGLDIVPRVKLLKAIAALKGSPVSTVEVPDKLQEPIVLASSDEDGNVIPMKVFSREGFKQALKGGGFVTVQNGTTKEQITEWEALVTAARDADTVLVLGGGLSGRVSNLMNYRRNRDTGLERITTSALALDSETVRRFSPLDVINNGEGVVVYLKDKNGNKDDAFMEVDGLVENTDVVFMNECKATLNKLHIVGPDGVVERALRLQRVLRWPDKYISSPPDVLHRLAGKRVIPVASSYKVDSDLRAMCLKEGVVLVSRDGPGGSFVVTFPPVLLEPSK